MSARDWFATIGVNAAVGLMLMLAVAQGSDARGDDSSLGTFPAGTARIIAAENATPDGQDGTMPAPLVTIPTAPNTPAPTGSPSLQEAVPAITSACSPLCCGELLSIAPNMIGGNFGAGTGEIAFSNIPHATVAKILMPNAAESVLGRQTIGDDSSPMPRDRFFFDYDYFYRVNFAPSGDTVDRFMAGFEKTFLDGQVSAEVRLPFGTTLDNDVLVKTGKVVKGITQWKYRTGEETLLGNVAVGAKALLYHIPDQFAVSAGLLVTVPTANDLSVTGLLSPLHATSATLQIKNEAVHLAPYLGALWTPTDRLFLQGFFQVDFDANGQDVVLENGASSSDLGRYRDQTFAFFDVGVGYWIVREAGVNWAGLFEVHYAASLQTPESVNIAPGQVNLEGEDGNVNLINLVLGTSLQVQDNKTLSVAYVFSVGAGQDEQFTREWRATFNWYF
jgi:hypothetical protein